MKVEKNGKRDIVNKTVLERIKGNIVINKERGGE